MIEGTVRFLVSLVLCGAAGCSLTTDLDELGAGGASAAAAGGGGAGGSSPTTSSSAGGGRPSGYREVVLRDNPVAYWRLGESLGEPVAIDEMTTYDAPYIGVITQGAPGAITGDDDTAVEFTTAGGRAIQLEDASQLGFEGLAEMSFELWIFPDLVDVYYRRILSKEATTDPNLAEGYHLYLQETEGLVWSRLSAGNWESLQSDTPTLNEYHHVVATFDGGTMRFYVNGELAGSRSSAGVLVETGQPFTVGAAYNLYSGFSGRIDELAIYDHALPGVVVLEHYVAGTMPR